MMVEKINTSEKINSDASDKFWRRSKMIEVVPADGSRITVSELCKSLASFRVAGEERSFSQTIRRDIKALVKLYGKDTLLIRAEKSKEKNTQLLIGWAKGKRPLDRFVLNEAQIIAFATLMKSRITLLPAHFTHALHRFEQMAYQDAPSKLGSNNSRNSGKDLSSSADRWLSKIESIPERIEFLEPIVDENILITVHRALMEEQSLRIRYKKSENWRLIQPLGLVQQGARTYLVAKFDQRDKVVPLLLARIDEAKLDTRQVSPPENFNLKDFLRRGIATPKQVIFSDDDYGKDINIRLKIERRTSWLKETPLSVNQKTIPCNASEPEGDYYLEATLPLTENLIWWILSMSDHVQVIEPKELRVRVISDLKAALSQYEILNN